MKQHSKILAIIPARGGSKGIPGKNIKLLGGKPLLSYTVEAAKKSNLITKLVLSSDDDKIIDIARSLNIEVPFKRPQHLATSHTGSLEVVKHVVKFFEEQGQFYDAVLLLQPTTPFREKDVIDQAILKFSHSKADALVSVLKVPHPYNPHWVFEENQQGYLYISTGESQIIKRRQDLPTTYFRDGSIYITKTEIIKKGSFFGEKLIYIKSNPNFYVNIDSEKDWESAEKILKTK